MRTRTCRGDEDNDANDEITVADNGKGEVEFCEDESNNGNGGIDVIEEKRHGEVDSDDLVEINCTLTLKLPALCECNVFMFSVC